LFVRLSMKGLSRTNKYTLKTTLKGEVIGEARGRSPGKFLNDQGCGGVQGFTQMLAPKHRLFAGEVVCGKAVKANRGLNKGEPRMAKVVQGVEKCRGEGDDDLPRARPCGKNLSLKKKKKKKKKKK